MDIQWIWAKVIEYIPIALAVVGAFALIATKTPNKVDNKIAQILVNIVNFMGANFGNAKNKDVSPKEEQKAQDVEFVEKPN